MHTALATLHVIGARINEKFDSLRRAVMLAKTADIKTKQYIEIYTSVLNSALQTLMVMKK